MKISRFRLCILVLSILEVLIAIFFSATPINTYSVNTVYRLSDFYSRQGYTTVSGFIDFSHVDFDRHEVNELINNAAISNDVIVYKLHVDTALSLTETAIYSTSNGFGQQNLLIEDALSVNASSFAYSSDSENKSLRIVTWPGINETLYYGRIYDDLAPGSLYNFVYKNGQQYKLDSFIQQLSNNCQGVSISINSYNEEIEHNVETTFIAYFDQTLFQSLGVKIALVVIGTLLLLCILLTFVRKISLLKVQGYSNFDIYRKFFLSSYIKNILVLWALFLCAFGLLYGRNLYTFLVIAFVYSLELFQIICLTLFFSAFYIYIFRTIPILSTIKGANKQSSITNALVFSKGFILLYLSPFVLKSLITLSNCVHIWANEAAVQSELSSYYYFSGNTGSTLFDNHLGFPETIEIRKELIHEFNLFSFAKVSNRNPMMVTEDELEWYEISAEFADMINILPTDYDIYTGYIFVSDGADYEVEKYESLYPNYIVVAIECTEPLFSYDLGDLLYSNCAKDIPLILHPEYRSQLGEVYGDFLVSDLSLDEVRNKVDSIFEKFNLESPYRVRSLRNDYQAYVDVVQNANVHSLATPILLVIAYLMVSMIVFISDYSDNKTRYFLNYIEGKPAYKVGDYLLRFFLIPMTFVICSLIINRSSLLSSMISLVFFLGCEICLYAYYSYFCQRRTK